VLQPLGPTQVKKAIGKRCANCTANVWTPFGPIETGATEVAALCAGSKNVDPEICKKTGAILGHFRTFVTEYDVFVARKKVGKLDAKVTGKVVVANPGLA